MAHKVVKKFRHPANWDHVIQPGDKIPDDLPEDFINDMIARGRVEAPKPKKEATEEKTEKKAKK